jgi:hypothetical protein
VVVDPARVIVTTGSSAAFILAFLTCSSPVTGSRSRSRLSALPAYPQGARLRGRADRDHGCDASAITPDMLIDAHRRAPLKGVLAAARPIRLAP